MIITLDTSVLIDIERGQKETREKLKELIMIHKSSPVILFIPYSEYYSGIINKTEKNFDYAYSFLQSFAFLEPTKKSSEILAQMKEKYERLGKNIALADLFIASQVKEHNLLLITKDKGFEKIDEIKCILF